MDDCQIQYSNNVKEIQFSCELLPNRRIDGNCITIVNEKPFQNRLDTIWQAAAPSTSRNVPPHAIIQGASIRADFSAETEKQTPT
jgi:hypothetical protein